jgi:hypothetical protein
MPETVLRNRGAKVYKVYSKAEADELLLPYVHWREAVAGGWALTDDDWVCECLGQDVFNKRVIKHFSISSRWIGKSTQFRYLDHKAAGVFGGTSPRNWVEREIGTKRCKDMIRNYAIMILNRAVDFDRLGALYRKDQKIPAATVKVLLRQEKVKTMVNKEVEQLLIAKGLSKDFIFQGYVEALEMAKTKQDITNLRGLLGDLVDLWDMKPKSVKMLDSATIDMSRQISEGFMKDMASLTLSKESEVPSGSVNDTEKSIES